MSSPSLGVTGHSAPFAFQLCSVHDTALLACTPAQAPCPSPRRVPVLSSSPRSQSVQLQTGADLHSATVHIKMREMAVCLVIIFHYHGTKHIGGFWKSGLFSPALLHLSQSSPLTPADPKFPQPRHQPHSKFVVVFSNSADKEAPGAVTDEDPETRGLR